MNSNRISQLNSMLESSPEDPFILYALALEHIKFDEPKAFQYFERLLSDFPEYLPTYFHAAGLCAEMEKLTKAQEIYEAGILLAKKNSDQHALSELQNSFQNFLIENDL